ncbi:Ankyrin repeat [Fusarium oxysporum f. sp. vasinfectum]|nr:Ankyrin repeat [Fusarium oxysporum f. sp. vasinfectum]
MTAAHVLSLVGLQSCLYANLFPSEKNGPLSVQALGPDNRDAQKRAPAHWAAGSFSRFLDPGLPADQRNMVLIMPSSAEAVWQKGSDALSHILRLFPSSADTGDVNGKTPLHLSWLKSVHLLIRNNARVNATARDGTVPLHIAAIYGQEKTVEALLESGADVNLQNAQGASALHCVALGELDDTEKLASTFAAPKWAVMGQLEIFKDSLSHFLPSLIAYDRTAERLLAAVAINDGWTSLNSASLNGHVEVVMVLLTTGNAHPDSADTKYGRTPLSFAAGNGHEPVAQLLLMTADVDPNSKDHIGRTPLFYAAWKGHRKLVGLLIADTRVEPDSPDHYALTPLLAAVANGHGEVVDVLIATNRVNIHCKDHFGRTPLSWVRRTGNAQIMKLLVEGGQKNGALISENGPIVEKEPLQNVEVSRLCDVCTGVLGLAHIVLTKPTDGL